EHGRRYEISPGVCFPGQPVAARNGAGAFLLPNAEIAGHAFELLFGHQRTDLGLRVDAIADLEAIAKVRHPADELIVDAALRKESRAGAADLTGIREHRHTGARHGIFEIRICEHDVGRFSPELERDPLEI